MELAIFLLPLISTIYTIIERNAFAQSSTERHIDALTQYGMKGIFLRNPNLLVVPFCFISSYWFISVGLYWLILGVLVLIAAALVVLYAPPPINLPESGTDAFEELRKQRQLQTIGTAVISAAWLLSWLYN